MEIPLRLTVLSINKCAVKEIGIGADTKVDKLQVFNSSMNTWLFILTWICLTTNCRSDDTDIRTMDQRLLLNDPNTLLSHIETLKREMTTLKSQVTSQQSEINAMQNQLVKRNPGNLFLQQSCRFFVVLFLYELVLTHSQKPRPLIKTGGALMNVYI